MFQARRPFHYDAAATKIDGTPSAQSCENTRYRIAKRLLVGRVERTQLADHEGLLDGGEDGFDNGGFEKPRGLAPISQYPGHPRNPKF